MPLIFLSEMLPTLTENNHQLVESSTFFLVLLMVESVHKCLHELIEVSLMLCIQIYLERSFYFVFLPHNSCIDYQRNTILVSHLPIQSFSCHQLLGSFDDIIDDAKTKPLDNIMSCSSRVT